MKAIGRPELHDHFMQQILDIKEYFIVFLSPEMGSGIGGNVCLLHNNVLAGSE